MSGEVTKSMIMAARLPGVAVPSARPAKGESGRAGIRRSEDTPFTVFSTGGSGGATNRTSGWTGPKEWSDGILKKQASMQDRAVLAIRDAAHCAWGKGIDPTVTPIYITSVIRNGWGLSSKELSKQLIRLEASGVIARSGERVKGRHSRFTLAVSGKV